VIAALAWTRDRMSTARDVKAGREVKQARQEVVREEQKKAADRKPPKIEAPAPRVEKSERVEKEKQVALFERPGSTELPELSLLDDAPPRAGGYSAEALEALRARWFNLRILEVGALAPVEGSEAAQLRAELESRTIEG
jgi:S-DNA-T family DNA segregation ATPase FtsK/SpoIIIE